MALYLAVAGEGEAVDLDLAEMKPPEVLHQDALYRFVS